MDLFKQNLTTTTTTKLIQIINNNGTNLLQDEMSNDEKLLILNMRTFVYGWLVLPMAIIGLLLNGFTVIVLLHPRMRNFSTNIYLTTLTFANIVCLINFIFLYSIRYLVSYEMFKKNLFVQTTLTNIHPYESFINFIYGIWSPIFTTFQLYAIYLTVAVTVDRWIYVTWPLKADQICTLKNTFKAVGFIFIFCFIYNLPRWFEIESFKQVSVTNQTYYQARTTKFGRHYIFNQIMRTYGYLIFVYGLPFMILLVVNIGIVQKMIEAKRRKKNLLGSSKKNNQSKPLIENGNNSVENMSKAKKTRPFTIRHSIAITFKVDPKITVMVMAVVVAFFLCQFPYLIVNILANSHQRKAWFQISKIVCDFLVALNCCINFLIYCFFGQNFRQIAKLILFNPSLNPYNKALLLKSAQMNEKSSRLCKKNSTVSEAVQTVRKESV